MRRCTASRWLLPKCAIQWRAAVGGFGGGYRGGRSTVAPPNTGLGGPSSRSIDLSTTTATSENEGTISSRPAPSWTVDTAQRELCRLGGLAYRSAYCREQIRDRSKISAVELGLRQFAAFTEDIAKDPLHERNRPLLDRCVSDIDRLDNMLALFERWYYVRRAPQVVALAAPWEWYPRARMMRRVFHFHSGPTNSGKTHAALQKLAAAKSGVYCAPLKALATQVWRRLNETVRCDLLIGDERQFAGFAEHVSCTVEMTPIDFAVDVGVIDEVQLISDVDRGWAWTRAILGLPAREIHLCGEARALELIKRLLYKCHNLKGFTVHRRDRLVPLELQDDSLNGQWDKLQNGDCVVTFSRKAVFNYAAQIRKALPHADVRMIYGSLPFAVREGETAAFNDAASVHLRRGKEEPGAANKCVEPRSSILVSTDAIAYGLNLSIRRVVFASLQKFDGRNRVTLPAGTAMQLAGRAGRYGMNYDCGYVTALHSGDCDTLRGLLLGTGSPPPRRRQLTTLQPTAPLTQAGLLPTVEILALYVEMRRRQQRSATTAPAPFVQLLLDFVAECSVDELFFPCDMERALVPVAKLVSTIDGMSDADRTVFCFAPVNMAGEVATYVERYARAHAALGPVHCGLDEPFEQTVRISDAERALVQLEGLYRIAEAYSWLGWRFKGTFVDVKRIPALKTSISNEIEMRLRTASGVQRPKTAPRHRVE